MHGNRGVHETAVEAGREAGAGQQHAGGRSDWLHREDGTERSREEMLLLRERAAERDLVQREERRRAREEERRRSQRVAWESFMEAERRELELRKGGQLAELLGEPLQGEPPASLRRLAAEDRRQAEKGLVALASNGKVVYKPLEELSEEDMPSRKAANRLRTTWLKERHDGWL